jgi:solute:Na+ symporter, SSS family
MDAFAQEIGSGLRDHFSVKTNAVMLHQLRLRASHGDAFLADWLRAALGLAGLDDAIPLFTLNGAQISFFATLISITLYVGVSLLTCRQDYPINKMLHRDEPPSGPDGRPVIIKKPWTFARIVGIDENFSRGDKWITGSLFLWSVGWFGVMLIGTAWNLLGQTGWVPWIKPWTNDAWLGFWHVTAIGLPILVTVVTGLWFSWGGIHDIRALFRSLRVYRIDDSDNGTVRDHKPF